VRADLEAGAGTAPVPRFGVGWCAVAESGGESVTLVSRARKAARISLQATQGRAQGYVRASSRDAAAARDPLLAAIAAGQFQILFQPIVPLHAAAAERYEATLRLTGPQGELLAPGVFVPVALRAGETARIDRWLLAAGLDALRERRAAGRPVELFLHQSIAAAADDTWVERVRDEIAARDLIQCRPIIQLQLADADRHLDLAARRAEQLNRLRIRLCLNGFVVGERGERVLARLPVAYVRLAREAAHGLSDGRLLTLFGDPRGRKTLVIATGVEGPEAITPLYRAGVDLVQGSYVQPPTESMDFDFADAGT
jgi:EAL domain-containing protein (putative c-di-GMP-specific phosphodiesterase class I)